MRGGCYRCLEARPLGWTLRDLISSLAELRDLNIAFISLTEALDFTMSAGRDMIGLLSVFAEF